MTKRNYLIDVLRGICVLFVIFRHVHIRIPFQDLAFFKGAPEWVWKFFFLNGNEGVIIFFVISGFLITSNSLKRYGSLKFINFSQFYRMRFARIFPLLLLLLSILSLLHFYEFKNFVIAPSKTTLGHALFSAVTFHLNWLEGQVGYLPGSWDVLWSLSVEEVFYFAFPIICLLTRKRAGFWLFAIFALIAPFYRNYTIENSIWSTKAYLSNMGPIAIGCMAALWSQHKTFDAKKSRLIAYLSFIGMLSTIAFVRYLMPEKLGPYRFDRDLLAILSAVFLVFCVRFQLSSFTEKLLYPFERFGKVSYEMYLFHMFFVYWGVDLYNQYGGELSYAIPLLVGIVVVTYALSFMLEKYFSNPLNRLIRNYKFKDKQKFTLSESID